MADISERPKNGRGDISTSVRLETTLSPVRIGSLDPKEELFIGSSAKSTIFGASNGALQYR